MCFQWLKRMEELLQVFWQMLLIPTFPNKYLRSINVFFPSHFVITYLRGKKNQKNLAIELNYLGNGNFTFYVRRNIFCSLICEIVKTETKQSIHPSNVYGKIWADMDIVVSWCTFWVYGSCRKSNFSNAKYTKFICSSKICWASELFTYIE